MVKSTFTQLQRKIEENRRRMDDLFRSFEEVSFLLKEEGFNGHYEKTVNAINELKEVDNRLFMAIQHLN